MAFGTQYESVGQMEIFDSIPVPVSPSDLHIAGVPTVGDASVASYGPILRPGATCWRIERARRFAQIVDAADYFRIVKAAMLRARHTILLIGWDFDARVELEPDVAVSDLPKSLGLFINWIVEQRPSLQVYILKWRFGVLKTLGRGPTPLFMLGWMFNRRIHFKLDGQHPVGACHHQKIVVIDDAIAFCGGIDITGARWDTHKHDDSNPHRVDSGGRPYGAWHDATTAVDGDAARALGEFSRERWLRATGERLRPPPLDEDPWPNSLAPTLTDVDVAIARTEPEYRGRPEIREIEALYLAGIGAAQHSIYLESQYFASRRIAEAIAARLSEANGPEIVVVNPESADGWLEELAMDTARARLLALIRRADQHNRFRIYVPITAAGESIYVHAKIMTIDDRLLRIGSSNLNNRSMGFDTESDLAIEALPGSSDEERIGTAIASVRHSLIAEHLAVSAAEVKAASHASRSLIFAIESLMHPGRRLVPFQPSYNVALEDQLAESELLDPERPGSPWTAKRRRTPRR